MKQEVLRFFIYLSRNTLKTRNLNWLDFLLRRAENEVAIEIKPLSVFHYDYTSRMNSIKVNTDK